MDDIPDIHILAQRHRARISLIMGSYKKSIAANLLSIITAYIYWGLLTEIILVYAT
jgi:hypothetical protein